MAEQVIDQIIAFAEQAHGSRQRKYTNELYIVHPVRVMEICRDYTSNITLLAAALLHDVLEDTEVTKAGITAFLNTVMNTNDVYKTISIIIELTDVYVKSSYPQWNRDKRKQMEARRIARTGKNAQTIKYADIIDNATEILQYDKAFGRKFLQECREVLAVAKKGNAALRERALQVVNQGLATFKHNSSK